MKTLFSEFSKLWNEEERTKLKTVLSAIPCLHYPEDYAEINRVEEKHKYVILVNKGTTSALMNLVKDGYEHCVQVRRPDLNSEILAAAYMISRPSTFVKNPAPYFASGFVSSNLGPVNKNFLQFPIHKSREKTAILNSIRSTMSKLNRLASISDIVLQVADELIMNALFNAPIDAKGVQCNRNLDRSSDVIIPGGRPANLFLGYNEDKISIGCEDPFGSFKKSFFIDQIDYVFSGSMSKPRREYLAGAGLGFKFIIENSASVYVYCDHHVRSIVTATFLQQGLSANLGDEKHLHFSIR